MGDTIMHEKISEQNLRDKQVALKSLAMQLVTQMHPLCHGRSEEHEVVDLMHGAIEWVYSYESQHGVTERLQAYESQDAVVLKVVS